MESKSVVSLRTADAQDPAATPAGLRRLDGKLLTLPALAEQVQRARADGRQIVLCHGTFDLLHIGHIRHLQRARREGDVLVVTVTADAYVNKGPGRPVFTHDLRAENLAALECVDWVAVNHAETAVNVLELVRPHVYVKGSDYVRAEDDLTGNIARERAAVERHGGRIFFTQELTSSSTTLLNEHFQVFPDAVKTYLAEFKSRWSLPDLHAALARLQQLRVLVLGDAIVDEYHYTSSLGQTGKGNVLAVRYQDEERFAGGSIAVANHVAGFAASVTLVCGLGGRESHEDFIRSKLSPKVDPVFLTNPHARTLVKRRYIGEDLAKLFEVYFHDEDIASPALSAAACDWLQTHLRQFDAVIVPDFGNGFITGDMVQVLAERSPFLAVNTQLNSGNRGYHVITRYPRADFVALNEPELRMAAFDRSSELPTLAQTMSARMDCKHLAVTRGTQGVLVWDAGHQRKIAVPALSTCVVDRIGAGDAFLALAGMGAAAGVDPEITAFIGSVGAALDVQIVCNRAAVSPVDFKKYATTLLK